MENWGRDGELGEGWRIGGGMENWGLIEMQITYQPPPKLVWKGTHFSLIIHGISTMYHNFVAIQPYP